MEKERWMFFYFCFWIMTFAGFVPETEAGSRRVKQHILIYFSRAGFSAAGGTIITSVLCWKKIIRLSFSASCASFHQCLISLNCLVFKDFKPESAKQQEAGGFMSSARPSVWDSRSQKRLEETSSHLAQTKWSDELVSFWWSKVTLTSHTNV